MKAPSSPESKVYLYRRIVQAKLFIDRNFAEPLNLDHIAEEAFFSKFHFIRLFRKIYGKTPHHYLTSVRIERAKLLLTDGLSIAQVCSDVGFESITSFTGLFKRMTGVTPSGYQQRQTLLRQAMNANPLQFVPNCFAESNGWVKKSNFQEV